MTVEQLPWRKPGTPYWRKILTLNLSASLILEQWMVPAGTEIKIKQSQDFGYIVIPAGTKDVRGFTIPRQIFRY